MAQFREITDGGFLTLDPEAEEIVHLTWDDELADGVTIEESEWSVTVKRPAGSAAALSALTTDLEAIDPDTSRATQIRLATPLLGALYRIVNRIRISGSTQWLVASFKVLGEEE